MSNHNHFLELTKERYSARKYSNRAVEREKIEYILECARYAPSAVNFQPWSFVIVQLPENRAKLHACYDREWFTSAPLYIIACGNHLESWKRKCDEKDFCDVDLAIAIEHICLAATEQGLGTCWVCNFDKKKCCDSFSLPTHIEPIAIIPVGYPADDEAFMIAPKKRKSINEVIKWEQF